MKTVLAWCGTRALMVWYFLTHPATHGDVYYYQKGVLPEYPDPSTWPLIVIGWFGDYFLFAFMGFVLLCDAAFSFWLRRFPASGPAVAFWLIFTALLTPVYLARLDVIPSLLVGIAAASPALLWALGLAAAAKLWPAALIPALGRKAGWAIGTAIAAVAVTVLVHGIDRVFSPLTYQRDRGLQIETLLATPFLWAKGYHIDYAASKSFEITGPGVATALTVSTVAMVLAGLVILAGSAVLWTRRYEQRTTQWFWLATILLIIVTAKVFSPQYLLWLGPLFAVMLATGPRGRRELLIAVMLLLAALLTSLVYPGTYDGIIIGASPWGLSYLTARNGLLLVLTVLAVGYAVTALGRAPSRRSDLGHASQ